MTEYTGVGLGRFHCINDISHYNVSNCIKIVLFIDLKS